MDSDFDENTDRYCCGCFGNKRTCVWFFVIFFVILLAGIIVAGYFLWPRIPVLTLQNPANAGASAIDKLTFNDTSALANASPSNPFQASMILNLNVIVFSSNYITYTFDDVKIDIDVMDPVNGKAIKRPSGESIGFTNSGRVSFPPLKNVTVPFKFDLGISISKPLSNIQEDRLVYALILSCGRDLFPDLPPIKNPNFLAIQATSKLFSKFLSWTGYNPSFTQKMNFPCPQGGQSFLNKIKEQLKV